MQETKTYKLSKDYDQAKMLKDLAGLGFDKEGVKSPYEQLRVKGNFGSIVFYTSGKVVAQLKSKVSEIDTILGGGNTGEADYVAHAGSDEVGKGDYFGPMVVVAAYVSEQAYEVVKKFGIVDSKKMNDEMILELYPGLEDVVKYEVSIIKPKEYNFEYAQIKNASMLLANHHGIVIQNLVARLKADGDPISKVIIDQFSQRKDRLISAIGDLGDVEVVQFHKGESDPAVAVASVLARARFLHEWVLMENEYGFKFPKGASDVISTGKAFVRNYGKDQLDNVAKTSFRTTKSVIA